MGDSPTPLHDLFTTGGQSPWLDNLRRDWIHDGTLARWVKRGARGVTSNPTIFAKAIAGGSHYDEQFAQLIADGVEVTDAYWTMVVDDIVDAVGLLRPVYDASAGVDGYVSVEVAPDLARDAEGTIQAAEDLWERIDAPNLYIKIPGTTEGLEAITEAIAAGISVNVTLLFSLERYDEVIEAYLTGMERLAATGQPLSAVTSVASFFVSRVDTEVDRRLSAIGTPEALALRSKAAVANAQMAYQLFRERFSGPRWEALAAAGAKVQRPLWASTSTKDPALPDTLYVDTLIGPDTVNTMPDPTLEAFEDHGTVARTVDADPAAAQAVLDGLAAVGVDLGAVTDQLEQEGLDSFRASFDELIAALAAKAEQLSR